MTHRSEPVVTLTSRFRSGPARQTLIPTPHNSPFCLVENGHLPGDSSEAKRARDGGGPNGPTTKRKNFFVVSHQSYASRPISFRVSVRTPDRDAQRASSICERRTLACCTYSAPWMLLEASVTSAEAARGRAFIDPNMAGRSPGLRSCFSVRTTRIRVSNHDFPSPVAQRMPGGTGGSIIGLYGRG